jgi:hypothetical protein
VKTNTLTWLALLLLTLTSFLSSDQAPSRGATAIILTTAGIKCSALGWNFMEVRAAHWFWRAALLGLTAALLSVVDMIVARGN